jgi:hypothetical protein
LGQHLSLRFETAEPRCGFENDGGARSGELNELAT